MAQCDDVVHRRILFCVGHFMFFEMIQVSNQAVSKNVGRIQPAPPEVSEYREGNLIIEITNER
jgi:hypothetical protein